MNKFFVNSIFLAIVLLVSCGKKAENKVAPQKREEPLTKSYDDFLNKQMVVCEANTICPSGIAKVVVLDRQNKPRFCTGFLVKKNILATAASCLPKDLRVSQKKCSDRIFSFFPKVNFSEAERADCDKILFSSDINHEEEAILWRSNLALIRLNKHLVRRPITMSRDGYFPSERLALWAVHAETDFSGIVKRQSCRPVFNTYVNPLSDNPKSSSVVVGDCHYFKGSEGAPLITASGYWRGLVSARVNQKVIDFLKEAQLVHGELRPMFISSNASCMPSTSGNFNPHNEECYTDLDQRSVDRARSLLIDPQEVHQESISQIKNQLNRQEEAYVQWDARVLRSVGGQVEFEYFPDCFSPYQHWLEQNFEDAPKKYVYSIKIPFWEIRLEVDHYARFRSQLIEKEEHEIFMEFSPRALKEGQDTYLSYWSSATRGFLDVFNDSCF